MDIHLKRNKFDEKYKLDGYPHPYRVEIEKFEPFQKQLEATQEILYKPLENTPLKWVCGREDFKVLVDKLSKETEIAIDLENHSFRSFQGFVCLMQISTRNEDFLVDTLELRNEMYQLNKVFTNPNIVKVLHGADFDIQWLQRDFGLYIVNLFDTGQASRVLEYPKFSLAYLLKHYCNVDADKQYQLADWRIRPLPEEMIKYAREDTHYLLYIYDRIKKEAIERGNENKNILKEILRRSKELCLTKYHKEIVNEDTSNTFYAKSGNQFNPKQLNAFKKLYFWRDTVARREDESSRYVIPHHMIFTIAKELPNNVENLLAICVPTPALLRIYSHEIINLIHDDSTTMNESFTHPVQEEENRGYFDSPVPDEKSLFQQIGWNIPVRKSDYKPPDLVKISDFDESQTTGLFRFDNSEQPSEDLKQVLNQINSSFDPSFSIRSIDFEGDPADEENISKVLKPLEPNEFENLSPPKKDVIPKSMAEIYKRANEIKTNLDKKIVESVKTETVVSSPLDFQKYETTNDEDLNKKRKRLEEKNNPLKKSLPVNNFMQEIGWVKEQKPKIITITKEKKDLPSFDYSSVNSNLGKLESTPTKKKNEFNIKAPKSVSNKKQNFKRGGKISYDK